MRPAGCQHAGRGFAPRNSNQTPDGAGEAWDDAQLDFSYNEHAFSLLPAALLRGNGSLSVFPQSNSPNEWLQVDFKATKKVTAIITQGAKAVFTHMFVKEFAVSSSQNGVHWSPVLQDGKEKVGRAAPQPSCSSPGAASSALCSKHTHSIFAKAVSRAVLVFILESSQELLVHVDRVPKSRAHCSRAQQSRQQHPRFLSPFQIFKANKDHTGTVMNALEPPLFARYVRIHPRQWHNHIALRIEFLGCDTQQEY